MYPAWCGAALSIFACYPLDTGPGQNMQVRGGGRAGAKHAGEGGRAGGGRTCVCDMARQPGRPEGIGYRASRAGPRVGLISNSLIPRTASVTPQPTASGPATFHSLSYSLIPQLPPTPPPAPTPTPLSLSPPLSLPPPHATTSALYPLSAPPFPLGCVPLWLLDPGHGRPVLLRLPRRCVAACWCGLHPAVLHRHPAAVLPRHVAPPSTPAAQRHHERLWLHVQQLQVGVCGCWVMHA